MFHQTIAILAGIIIGFATSVPIGPVGIIAVQRTISKSKIMGLVTGLGAALSDGFLASVGAFGIKSISDFILEQEIILRIIGGGLLIMLGIASFLSKPKEHKKRADTAITIIQNFISSVVLTITNPLTMITFFISFGVVAPRLDIAHSPYIALSLVIGVIIGSCLWWLLLTYIANILGHKIRPEHLHAINKWFGFVIAILGGIVFVGAILRS